MSDMSDRRYREKAYNQYQDDGRIEIDEGAPVSRGADDGAYVQAWVWVYDDNPICEGDRADDDDAPIPYTLVDASTT